MNTHIVLGLGYGDEGKGGVTDALCDEKNPIVVRFSGGQQAGHTVIRDGVKHVHSSFGSGTLKGVPSFFSEHTCFYIPNMNREYEVLKEKGANPKLFIHPLALVTTPYDVAYNRYKERSNKHGSCGMGIAATFKRNLGTPYKLYAIDTKNKKVFFEKLNSIKMYYEGLVGKDSKYENYLIDEEKAFKELMFQQPYTIADYSVLYKYANIVFEGSQGIMLDMDHGFFPNVTYGNTTSKNAMAIIKEMKLFPPQIYYVTRCYQTRHGTGYMSDERELKLINTEEEINVFNPWQKNLRVGEIDYDMINHAIQIDKIYSKHSLNHLFVTCLDQRENFSFEYSKLNHNFATTWESHSPLSQFKLTT